MLTNFPGDVLTSRSVWLQAAFGIVEIFAAMKLGSVSWDTMKFNQQTASLAAKSVLMDHPARCFEIVFKDTLFLWVHPCLIVMFDLSDTPNALFCDDVWGRVMLTNWLLLSPNNKVA